MKALFVVSFIALTGVLSTGSYAAETETFDIVSIINTRFAETTVTSKIKNNEDTDREIQFRFLLPKEAFITSFSMTIDEITYEGEIEEKEKAKKTFEAAKRVNKTAGLVSTEKESTKTFKTSVNIAAGESVRFKLVYQQLLRRIRGLYKHQIILLGSQLTDTLTINVYICEPNPIKELSVPPILSSDGENVTVATKINRDELTSAHVEYLSSENGDLIKSLASTGGSFEVQYDVERSENGKVIVDDGHVMYVYVPDVKILPRRIVFVLDVSGSMQGLKIEQLKTAMINFIHTLTELDHFGIYIFSSAVNYWKPSLVSGTQENKESAKNFILRMKAEGGTNIEEGLKQGLAALYSDIKENEEIDTEQTYVVFLTDGQPTSGVTDIKQILDNVDKYNAARNISIHSIGFGAGVDASFLKALAARNQGTWTQILTDINANLQIQNYLDELGFSPIQNYNITVPDSIEEYVIPYFSAGTELTVYGRFKSELNARDRGPYTFKINEDTKKEVVAVADFYLDQKSPTCKGLEGEKIQNFGEKAFGLAKVTKVLRQYDAEKNESRKETLKLQAITLSLEYHLVTTVTSMLVIKPQDKEEVEEELNKIETTAAPRSTSQSLTTTTTTSSPSLTTTSPWWAVQGDPHFVVHLSETVTVCFNLIGKSGEVFNLMRDPKNSITINGLLEGIDSDSTMSHAIFITKLKIILKKENVAITVTPTGVLVQDISNHGKRSQDLNLTMINIDPYKTRYGKVELSVDQVTMAHTLLTISVGNNISFIVNLHHESAYTFNHLDHLDLMVTGTEHLSRSVGGVFGSFPRNHIKHSKNDASIEDFGTKHILWYNQNVTPVKKTKMMVPYLHQKVDCWFVAKPAAILGTDLKNFKVNSLDEIPKSGSRHH